MDPVLTFLVREHIELLLHAIHYTNGQLYTQ